MKQEKIYIAYGSNMNKKQMKYRCPNAKPIGKGILKNYKLEFRGVATIVESVGDEVPIAVWTITEECEKALDIYEGYPRLYRKEYLEIETDGKIKKGMVYIMNKGHIAPPNNYYLKIIAKGYADFKIGKTPLNKALEESLR